MTFDFRQAFVHAANTPSDINEHLPLMNILAKLCKHVTEFGVRWATSTTAWMNNPVILRAYDIAPTPPAEELFAYALAAGKDAKFIIQDTTTLESIEQTDLLFIDSPHTYHQLKIELKLAKFVNKFMVFHDTVVFGDRGEDGTVPGLNQAIAEFLQENQDWTVMEHRYNNNGLTVLVRRNFL
jgi:cephalosporin hydroxylase